MRTIDGQKIKGNSLWSRFVRDVRLLWRIGQMLFAYLVAGRRIRRVYQEKAARGEIYWVDQEPAA
ncbi:MAG: hypothetical protein HC802_14270 [Caldilineaceae bacterium]|nr:hypothetical protein [Caldilineaceae bacterium]